MSYQFDMNKPHVAGRCAYDLQPDVGCSCRKDITPQILLRRKRTHRKALLAHR